MFAVDVEPTSTAPVCCATIGGVDTEAVQAARNNATTNDPSLFIAALLIHFVDGMARHARGAPRCTSNMADARYRPATERLRAWQLGSRRRAAIGARASC